MKAAKLISLLLVVVAVATPVAVCDEPAVLDIDGNPVLPDVLYYIETLHPGIFVTHSEQAPGIECPQAAVLTSPFFGAGTPVKFIPEGGSDYVPISTNLSTQFRARSWPCDESKVWRVDLNSPNKRPDISTDGFNGGEESTFKIEKLGGNNYKFVYCNTNSFRCSDVGVFTGPDSTQHLALSSKTLTVMFKTAFPSKGIRMYPSH